ncbi:MAG: Mur ligase domain-containing protein, partial [Clostridiales Family XIII bacterium]|nr:Mur ligase domain-containing protein [Clostridiales Family XIII bacterium]
MIDLSKLKHIHCIGIGGIGLSAIAEILLREGYTVSGSDMKEGETTDRLISCGANIFLGHRAKNIAGAELIVYSSAVPSSNPELVAADELGIPTATRAEILGLLMARRRNSVAVAGAHGKTTTTAMISLTLLEHGLDPTILVGGNLPEIAGNVSVGGSEYFVTEACEYMDSFLELSPRYAIILNIDSDHLDYFEDIDHIVRSFDRFANLVHEDGAVVAFDANPFVSGIIRDTDRRVITFGFHAGCTYCAQDVRFNADGMPAFTIYFEDRELIRIQLAIPGDHNVANALAAFACCHDMGLAPEQIAQTFTGFTGTQR